MTMFLFKLICIVLTPKKSRFLHGENESNPRKFDDLENKIIILGGDFNLFLDSVPKSEGGSLVLKKNCFKTRFHWEYIYELDLCQICKALKNHQ